MKNQRIKIPVSTLQKFVSWKNEFEALMAKLGHEVDVSDYTIEQIVQFGDIYLSVKSTDKSIRISDKGYNSEKVIVIRKGEEISDNDITRLKLRLDDLIVFQTKKQAAAALKRARTEIYIQNAIKFCEKNELTPWQQHAKTGPVSLLHVIGVGKMDATLNPDGKTVSVDVKPFSGKTTEGIEKYLEELRDSKLAVVELEKLYAEFCDESGFGFE